MVDRERLTLEKCPPPGTRTPFALGDYGFAAPFPWLSSDSDQRVRDRM